MKVRLATQEDAAAIATIYNQGIEDRVATFETNMRSEEDVKAWFDSHHPIVVVEDEEGIIAFGSTFAYSSRSCYAGIAECSVYVKRDKRRLWCRTNGIGGAASDGRSSRILETDLACFYRE